MADSDKYYYTDNEIHGSLYSIVYAVRQITAGFANASDGKYNIEMNGNGGKLTMKKNSYPTEPMLAGKIPVALCDQKNAEAVIIDGKGSDLRRSYYLEMVSEQLRKRLFGLGLQKQHR